ncbi:Magnesium transporter MgtE [Nymphon striatum]|nr:Magnesium transporter MgtE [Nymphon striatum]
MDQEEAAQIFEQYDLLSAAVVDENERLVGVLTIDDVVDVIQQEAEEDFKRLAGVGDEELSDNVINTTKSRFVWLLVNLATAILASYVIGLFDATIQQMVALAVLMPIVASMGGNAGTQTMTVAVRALATKDIDIYNANRIIRRELTVGFINGVLFAAIVGAMAAFWFESSVLGTILGAAMIINMVCAALAGILIPLTLDKLNIDPASASSVFVTTVTDVDEGLIAPVRRGRTRLFRPSDRILVKQIMRAKRLGFSIAEIREIINIYKSPTGEAGQLHTIVEKVEEKRVELRQKRKDIEDTLAELDAVEEACVNRLAEMRVTS